MSPSGATIGTRSTCFGIQCGFVLLGQRTVKTYPYCDFSILSGRPYGLFRPFRPLCDLCGHDHRHVPGGAYRVIYNLQTARRGQIIFVLVGPQLSGITF